MERTTIFLPVELRRRLADEARRRGVARAQLVRDALARYLDEPPSERPRLVGSGSAPGLDAREAKRWARERWASRG